MEESKALNKLIEAADLVGMVEELLSPTSTERLSASAWSGIRITIRNIKDTIESSHSALAQDLVQRSRAAVGSPAASPINETAHPASDNGTKITNPVNFQLSPSSEAPRIQMTRKDLKASLEKFIER